MIESNGKFTMSTAVGHKTCARIPVRNALNKGHRVDTPAILRGSTGRNRVLRRRHHNRSNNLGCSCSMNDEPRYGAGGQRSFTSIPILDLSKIDSPGFLDELRETCHSVGFMYVVNHGVPAEVCEGTLRVAGEFFNLPTDEKMSIHHSKSPAFRGYIKHAAENTGGLPDLREQVEFGVDYEAPVVGEDGTAAGVFPIYKRLIGPNQWPTDDQVPGFQDTTEAFTGSMHELSMKLIGALVQALGLPPDSLDNTIGSTPNMQMKIAKYPPARPGGEEDGPGGFYGVGPHSDSGYLSILLQDEIGGLQVLNGAGEWVDAPPVPGGLVVNLGEMLQLVSGGYYLATVHRVLPPPAGGPARLSVPYFFNPKLDADISPLELPETLEWKRPPPAMLGETQTHGGKNQLLSQYGDNAFKSLARSHPAVLAAHHPDLEIGEDGIVRAVAGTAAQ